LTTPSLSATSTPAQPIATSNRLRERFFFTLTLLLALVYWLPQAIRWMNDSDFGPHGEDVKRTLDSLWWVITNIPHFMFQALSAGISRLFGWDVYYSMALVILLAIVGAAAALYLVYRHALGKDTVLTWQKGMLLVGAVMATLLVAPLNFANPENLYFGYFAPNVYHNPTVNLMKPSAIVLFFGALACFNPNWRPKPVLLWTVGYALLTAFCLFSKPNFLIAALPALALVTLYHIVRRRPIHWLLLIGGIVLPAGLLLFVQTQTWTTSVGIEFSPFEVYSLWAYHYEPTANQGLLFKHLASVVFPLAVYVLYWRESVRSLAMNTAWLTFFFGMAYIDLLIDRSNPTAGDFSWSAQFGVFLLFMTSIAFLIRRYATARLDWRLGIVGVVLALHLIAGVNWYWVHLSSTYTDIIFKWW
jgi:hypothetical protein